MRDTFLTLESLGWLSILLVLARAASAQCGVRFDLHSRSSLIALSTAVLACLFAIAVQPDVLKASILCLIVACCAVCALTDRQSGLIFDRVTYSSAVFLVILSCFAGRGLDALSGLILAGGGLAAIYCMTLGHGLGLGDLKLGCCIGVALGFTDAAVALGAAFVAGGAYGVWLLASRRANVRDELRFGPYLAAGVAFALLTRYAV